MVVGKRVEGGYSKLCEPERLEVGGPFWLLKPMSPKTRGLAQHGDPLQLILFCSAVRTHDNNTKGVSALERQCSDT